MWRNRYTMTKAGTFHDPTFEFFPKMKDCLC